MLWGTGLFAMPFYTRYLPTAKDNNAAALAEVESESEDEVDGGEEGN